MEAAARYVVTCGSARRQSDDKYVLYPGTSLTYVLRVGHGATSWEVPRRYSEVKKFWDALKPVAAAAGAPISDFKSSSAFMTGAGYTGNLYETDPSSKFAEERVTYTRALMHELSSCVDASGGQLFNLKPVRAFFNMDKHEPRATTSNAAKADAEPAAGSPGSAAAAAQDDADDSLLASLTRTTPSVFVFVFAIVLASLYASSQANL
ncbi:hypothetical protein M885DRAFT_543325 [Pelagophyceae sp. CCMP2097]|nr:hypothetical protein M885DRAFT_543325 [Pelagophyceae sp. CCMP2097]